MFTRNLSISLKFSNVLTKSCLQCCFILFYVCTFNSSVIFFIRDILYFLLHQIPSVFSFIGLCKLSNISFLDSLYSTFLLINSSFLNYYFLSSTLSEFTLLFFFLISWNGCMCHCFQLVFLYTFKVFLYTWI